MKWTKPDYWRRQLHISLIGYKHDRAPPIALIIGLKLSDEAIKVRQLTVLSAGLVSRGVARNLFRKGDKTGGLGTEVSQQGPGDWWMSGGEAPRS